MGANDINTSFVEIYDELSGKLENLNLNKLYILFSSHSSYSDWTDIVPGKTISKMSKYQYSQIILSIFKSQS